MSNLPYGSDTIVLPFHVVRPPRAPVERPSAPPVRRPVQPAPDAGADQPADPAD